MFDQLIEYDQDVFLFLNNLGSQNWDNFWLLVTNKFTFIPLYAFLLYLLFKHLGLKKTLLLLIVIVAMITFTDQIANVFKYGVKRPRPCGTQVIMEHMRFIALRCGRFGFFSAHAANSMAIAVLIGLLLKQQYKNLIFLLLFWSTVVGYSRIYLGVHFPLDVICGMAFGAFSGFLFYKLAMYLFARFMSS